MTSDAATGRSVALIAAGQGAVKSTQVVVALVLVRMVSEQSWNQLALLLSIHLAVVTFGGFGLQHTLVFHLADPVTNQRRLVARTLAIALASGVMIAVALSLAAPVLGSTLDVEDSIPWIALAAALELPATCVQPAVVALKRFRLAAAWDIAGAVTTIGGIVGAAAVAGVEGVVRAMVVVALVRTAAAIVVVGTMSGRHAKVAARGLSHGMPRLAEQLTFAAPLGLTLATGVLTRTVDKWFITAFHPDELGRYAIVSQEIPLLAVLPYASTAAVAAGLAAAFRAADLAEARRLWIGQARSMTRIVVPLTAAVIWIAPTVVPLAVDSTDPVHVVVFVLFTVITAHRVAEYGVLLRAAGRPRAVLSASLVLLGCNAVLAGVGTWQWGAAGAAAATLAAHVIAWGWMLRRIADALGTTVSNAFPWTTWGSASLAGLVGVVAATAAGSLVDGTVTRLLVGAAAFTTVVVAADRRDRRPTSIAVTRAGAS